MDNFYTRPILFKLLKERGILAAGTSRPRKNYPSEELKREKLSKRGEVAWLSWLTVLLSDGRTGKMYNFLVLDGHVIPHLPRGRHKRDLLSFQEELCIPLVGNFPQIHSGLPASEQRRSGEEVPGRLHEVGKHFPVKGGGTNHCCAVCEKNFKESKRRQVVSFPRAEKPPSSVSFVMFICALEVLRTTVLAISTEIRSSSSAYLVGLHFITVLVITNDLQTVVHLFGNFTLLCF